MNESYSGVYMDKRCIYNCEKINEICVYMDESCVVYTDEICVFMDESFCVYI
jgi:hypothetical protein